MDYYLSELNELKRVKLTYENSDIEEIISVWFLHSKGYVSLIMKNRNKEE